MTMNDISACDHLVAEFEAVINKPKKIQHVHFIPVSILGQPVSF